MQVRRMHSHRHQLAHPEQVCSAANKDRKGSLGPSLPQQHLSVELPCRYLNTAGWLWPPLQLGWRGPGGLKACQQQGTQTQARYQVDSMSLGHI
jgi:hypothetical protein